MTREQANLLQRRGVVLLQSLARELGVDVTVTAAGGTIGDPATTLKFKFTANQEGKAVSEFRQNWQRYHYMAGLGKEDLDRVFTFNGKQYRIDGINPRAHKRPVIGADISSGKLYTFSPRMVLGALTPLTNRT